MHKVFKPGEAPKDYNYEEPCPHCGEAIPVLVDNDESICYEVTCPVCGEKIMLCTLCHWDGEEIENCPSCDWSPENGCWRMRKEA